MTTTDSQGIATRLTGNAIPAGTMSCHNNSGARPATTTSCASNRPMRPAGAVNRAPSPRIRQATAPKDSQKPAPHTALGSTTTTSANATNQASQRRQRRPLVNTQAPTITITSARWVGTVNPASSA